MDERSEPRKPDLLSEESACYVCGKADPDEQEDTHGVIRVWWD